MRARSAVAVALVLLVGSLGLVGGRAFWQAKHARLLDQLVAAAGSDLELEPRLSGGFHPGRDATQRRGLSVGTPSLSPDVRIAIARIEKDASINLRPDLLGALGVAYLIEDDFDRSISTLEEATSVADDASIWSDLSAAYLVKAERIPARRIEYLARALEAASHSLKVASTGEARFNHALASGKLARFFGGADSWAAYLAAERDPGWKTVAQRHAAVRHGPEKVSWQVQKGQLQDRLGRKDVDFVKESARIFPERVLEFLDQELLIGWARAQTTGDTASATAKLRQASALAEAFFVVTNDRMPKDAILTIQALADSSQQHALRELAEAHLAFMDGVANYRSDDYEAASRFNDRARVGFEAARSPYWAWSALQKAILAFQQRDLDTSDRELIVVAAYARQKNYPTLLGRTLRHQGLTRSKQWRLVDALEAFEAAAASFEAAGERENGAKIYSQMASTLRSLGERQTSWEYIGRALDGLVHVELPIDRYLALFNASLFASSQELLEPALLFQSAAVQQAMARGGAPVVEALTQRASIFVRRGERDRALKDLDDARTRLAAVPNGPLKRYEKAELDVLLAEMGAVHGQASAIDGLRDAIAFFSTAEPALVPRLHLGLARAQLAAHAIDEAQDALTRGITTLESQQSQLGDEALKLSYFDDSWGLFTEMIELQLSRHDLNAAFEYAERSRARALLARVRDSAQPRPLRLSEVLQRLPPSTVLVYYATLSSRILIWTVTQSGPRVVESSVRREELGRLISKHLSFVTSGGATGVAVADRLYDLLIQPVASALANDSTLIIVADGDLQRLPFATLRSPSTSRYLIEDHPIVAAPSATFFDEAVSRLRQLTARPIDSALLVGNPESGSQSVGLPSLRGAEAEANAAAEFYRRKEVLTGRAATKQRFLQGAPDYDVVHFGGHAIVNVEYPLLSRLSFSPVGDSHQSEALFGHEISRMPFTHTRLVVLAACSTAVGAVSRGEGVVSVARPFLAAGVPVVVASQWDVDDRATEQLFVSFHRALASTQDPVRALRDAQLSLLRGNNAALSSPMTWGGFIALGATVR